MKIFTAAQIHELDKYTIEHEPIASIDLMERAAKAVTRAIMERWTDRTPIRVFAGPGNNGGDALAVSRMLAEANYQVTVYLFNIHNKLSEDCAINKQRLIDCKRIEHFYEISQNFDPPQLDENTLVIDGLFGTGLNKPLVKGFASLVKYINTSPSQVVSIDIPSGLMCEDNSYNVSSNIIRAHLTLTFQQPKLAMLLSDCQPFLGQVRTLDIRLSPEFIDKTVSHYNLIEENDIRPLIKIRHPFAHKGQMGHALMIAGSYGMAGAATLATRACLRAGVGKITVCTPRRNYDIMQLSIPEAILSIDPDECFFSQSVMTDGYNAIGIGPGLGKNENTAIALISQIRGSKCPVVIDADAINILASHRAWLQQLPPTTIMTPHPTEFDRLNGSPCTSDYERLSKAIELAEHLQSFIILKGHHSALCTPQGQVYFNTTGNAGMATAGSGDVLTGIITGLLARGYERSAACMVGMYLHGLAGDLAAKQLGQESLIAGDIIQYLPQAFQRLMD